ncbi:hypothetical protein B0T11DRAFT_282768 [Plectosphaerella cucumerina]|uniref:Uncharacterized protein n=1 Tax=Plectosphaerella cucumerina TaxID=40658 RepID=A0A8K0X674_9PEZI|nr:hypothetical protein B0T11DRAFT_286119 [Plectosphaerella cucumerina]KAH7363540.1 hypothetical protein B0T11DRAFT_282768 [Plectosphaerella cucumerina]
MESRPDQHLLRRMPQLTNFAASSSPPPGPLQCGECRRRRGGHAPRPERCRGPWPDDPAVSQLYKGRDWEYTYGAAGLSRGALGSRRGGLPAVRQQTTQRTQHTYGDHNRGRVGERRLQQSVLYNRTCGERAYRGRSRRRDSRSARLGDRSRLFSSQQREPRNRESGSTYRTLNRGGGGGRLRTIRLCTTAERQGDCAYRGRAAEGFNLGLVGLEVALARGQHLRRKEWRDNRAYEVGHCGLRTGQLGNCGNCRSAKQRTDRSWELLQTDEPKVSKTPKPARATQKASTYVATENWKRRRKQQSAKGSNSARARRRGRADGVKYALRGGQGIGKRRRARGPGPNYRYIGGARRDPAPPLGVGPRSGAAPRAPK